MSGDSLRTGSFVVVDYVVFVLMLVVSVAIGFVYAWTSRGRESSSEFLTGGRQLTALPVSMSLAVSFMSSVTMLAIPVEVYHYGAIFVLVSIANTLAVVVTSEVFLPVFYRLGITSIFEYLEMRFNRATRLLATVLFIIYSTLFCGVIIYVPSLALNQAAGTNLWVGICSTASVCTLYCTLGGLKAVVWTDVFQIGVMLAGYLSVIIKTVILQGGVSTILADSQEGGRLNLWDFDINPLRRHTFWTLVIGGTVGWTFVYGTDQSQVQRYISCKSITHARLAVYINLLGLYSILLPSMFAGLCLYSLYKHCDPWTAGLISAPDQLMPYLVMDILTDLPGLPGLFFAGIFSACLSTVSSAINALAAVTQEDLLKPYINLSDKNLFILSKTLRKWPFLVCSLFYGLLCIAMAGLASFMEGMVQAVSIIFGVIGGPLLGLFSLGVLCPFVNSKGGSSGLVLGLVATISMSIGQIIFPPPPEMNRPLSLTTGGCNFTTPGSLNWTSTPLPTEPSSSTTAPAPNDVCYHSPSYLYLSVIGTGVAMSVGVAVSLLTGGWRESMEPKLMLMKEDTMSYHLFKFLKDCVIRRTRKADVTRNGNTNPAFCDTEYTE
ncbi:sodium-coupled monocarboxylate transporter 1-like [Brachyistius frenatus]|uniref:sodium-coupled monocarboxylate transporter 1-like n=1 Tax=Brachyistius frenatus TaxID=100188 RepID=UPI0037E7C672